MGLFTTSLRFFFSLNLRILLRIKEKAETHLVVFSTFAEEKYTVKTEAISVGSATVGGLMPIERSIQQHSISHFEMSHCHLASK